MGIPNEAPEPATSPRREDFPDAVTEARAERFLARVAALTPEEWGRLDAIGERMTAGDLLTRMERVQRTARMTGAVWQKIPPSRETLVVMRATQMLLVTFSFVRELRDWVTMRERKPWRPPPRVDDATGRSPQAQRTLAAFAAWSDRLFAIAEAQPGGPGFATCSLCMALSAILCGGPSAMQLMADLYAPVEPVIPFASLDAA